MKRLSVQRLSMVLALAVGCGAVQAATLTASICVRGWQLRDLNPFDLIAPSATATNDFGSNWDGGSSDFVNVDGRVPGSANYPIGTGFQMTSLPPAPGTFGFSARYHDYGSFAPGQTAAFSTLMLSPHTSITFSVLASLSGSVGRQDDLSTRMGASLWATDGRGAMQRMQGFMSGRGSFSQRADWSITVINDSADFVEFEPIRGVDLWMETEEWGG